MRRPFFVVDAFTSTIGKGNPAAVVFLEGADTIDSARLCRVAAEMNLSETCFVQGLDDGTVSIRWFTPTQEVQLCGHATLAATHALLTGMTEFPFLAGMSAFQSPAGPTVQFSSHRAGALAVDVLGEGRYRLRFPARPPESVLLTVGRVLQPLCESLRIPLSAVADVQLHHASQKYLLVLNDSDALRAAIPSKAAMMAATAALDPQPLSVTLTAAEGPGGASDVTSRHFAPWVGIDEDPVTGAAHVVLVPYWLRSGAFPSKEVLRCHQAFPGRGGDLVCGLLAEGSQVGLEGSAVTFSAGILHI